MADLENEVHYWEGVKQVRLLQGTPGQAGARYRREFEAMGRVQTTTMELVEVQPNQRLVVQSDPGPITVRGTLWFEALPEATKVNLTLEATPRGLARLVSGKIERGMTRNAKTSLARLKQLLESGGPR